MGAAEQPPPLVEPFSIQSVFLSGIEVEEIGNDCFHFLGYIKARSALDGTTEHQVVLKGVMTREDVLTSLYKVAKAIGWSLAGEIAAKGIRVQRNH